jgi:HTH-type transcriptional regulator/antitoxin HigA
MNTEQIKTQANALFTQASFIAVIRSETEHEQALELMESLIEDYDTNEPLIDILCHSITEWESKSNQFIEFNQAVAAMGNGVAVLKTLMDQYQLKTSDFENEIGSKSLVSMITNNQRQLTLGHIHALSKRFGLSPKVFV